MTCADAMRRQFRKCVPQERLLDALEIMEADASDWAAVVESHENPRWLGWITLRDAALFLGAFDRRPSEVMCEELISAAPMLLAPADSLDSARSALDQLRLDRLPVVDNGLLAGILARAPGS